MDSASSDFAQPLLRLYEELEVVFVKYPQCEDTDVRDHICAVLQESLISGNLGTRVPTFYGIFSIPANVRLRKAMLAFLNDPAVRQFVESNDGAARVETLKSLTSSGVLRTASGQPLDELLGDWV